MRVRLSFPFWKARRLFCQFASVAAIAIPSTTSASDILVHLPCAGSVTNGNTHCTKALYDCDKVLPDLLSRFDEMHENWTSVAIDKQIDLDVYGTADINNPKGPPLGTNAACRPTKTKQDALGKFRNSKDHDCGLPMRVVDAALEDQGYRGDLERALATGSIIEARTCHQKDVRKELMAGSLKVTQDQCKPLAKDVLALLNEQKNVSMTVIETLQSDKAAKEKFCQQVHADEDQTRDYCEKGDGQVWDNKRTGLLARGCAMAKAMSLTIAAFERLALCEMKARTETAWRKVAISNPPADQPPLHAQVLEPTYLSCAEKGGDAAEDHFLGSFPNPSISKSKRHGIGVAQNCIDANLHQNWKTWIEPIFPANGGCRY